VTGGDGAVQRLVGEPCHRQAAALLGAGHPAHADVDRAGAQGLDLGALPHLVDAGRQGRVLPQEAGQHAGQQAGDGRGDGADPQHRGFGALGVREEFGHLAGPVEQGAGLGHEQPAGGGQPQAASGAVEEGDAEPPFQPGDGLAERGLRHVETAGRGCDAHLFRHGEEVTQRPQVHHLRHAYQRGGHGPGARARGARGWRAGSREEMILQTVQLFVLCTV
jgi:hypothetical protein